jgi:hypothetical protein
MTCFSYISGCCYLHHLNISRLCASLNDAVSWQYHTVTATDELMIVEQRCNDTDRPGPEVLAAKPVTLPLCPSQISHVRAGNLTLWPWSWTFTV